jgi:queuine/archaeosine tRNA-ribosyltransferase
MAGIRAAIESGDLDGFARDFYARQAETPLP